MPAYKDKSHEELRWEDYQQGDKGGPNPAGQTSGGMGFNTNTIQSNPFSSSPTFSQLSANFFFPAWDSIRHLLPFNAFSIGSNYSNIRWLWLRGASRWQWCLTQATNQEVGSSNPATNTWSNKYLLFQKKKKVAVVGH